MHARVATFEGAGTDNVRQMVEEIRRQSDEGPRPGIPAVGLLLLHSPEQGKVIAISLFANEEDLRTGDATLSAMDPPVQGGMGRRTSVEMFEVPLKLER